MDIISSSLLFSPGSTITLTWSPDNILPVIFQDSMENLTVDISIYLQQYKRSSSEIEWNMEEVLTSNEPNDGRAEVTVPSMPLRCNTPRTMGLPINVCPVAFKISISKEFSIELIQSTRLSSIGIWTGIGYLPSNRNTETSLRLSCGAWRDIDEQVGGSLFARSLPPCPPNQALANLDSRYEIEVMSSIVGTTSYDKSSFTLEFQHASDKLCESVILHYMDSLASIYY